MRRTDPRITHRRPELSQHFLRDAATARAIVRRLPFSPGDLVVEAGAGDGLLTEALAGAGFHVLAVEKDERLFGLLRQRLANRPDVACHRADFLTFPLPSVPYRVVSNVPYAITAALVRKLLHAARRPTMRYSSCSERLPRSSPARPVRRCSRSCTSRGSRSASRAPSRAGLRAAAARPQRPAADPATRRPPHRRSPTAAAGRTTASPLPLRRAEPRPRSPGARRAHLAIRRSVTPAPPRQRKAEVSHRGWRSAPHGGVLTTRHSSEAPRRSRPRLLARPPRPRARASVTFGQCPQGPRPRPSKPLPRRYLPLRRARFSACRRPPYRDDPTRRFPTTRRSMRASRRTRARMRTGARKSTPLARIDQLSAEHGTERLMSSSARPRRRPPSRYFFGAADGWRRSCGSASA